MPLETGTWTINFNGLVGQLEINSVDTQGNTSGTLTLGGQLFQIQGF